MRPAHIRNTCILVCAVLSVAACSTTRRLGSDEVLYTGVKKIRIEPDSGVVLSAAAESAVKEPLSVAPNNPLYSPYIRTPLPIGLWAYNYLYTPRQKGFKYWLFKRLAKQPVLISKGTAPGSDEGRGTGARKLQLVSAGTPQTPALPQTRAEGKGVLYARHSAALALFEDRLPGGGQRHGASHGQPPGHVLPRMRQAQYNMDSSHISNATNLPAYAQQDTLFPSRDTWNTW